MAKKIKIKTKKRTSPKDFDIAVQYYQAGNLQQAEAVCRQILGAQQGHADAWHLLGVIAGRSGRYDESIYCMEKAILIKPDRYSYYNDIGVSLKFKGVLNEAKERLEKAIELKPDFAEAYDNLGAVLQQMGMFEEAIANHNKCLLLNPNYPAAYNNLGNALREKGFFDDAIENFNKAMSLNPLDAELHNNLGFALLEKGSLDEALDTLQSALELNPDIPEIFNNLGLVFTEKGLLDEAVDKFIKAVSLRPHYPEAYNNLGIVYMKKSMLEMAIKNYDKALTLRPDFAMAHYNRGNVFVEKGMQEEAIENYNKALMLKPDLAEAYNSLGHTFINNGLSEKAICNYEKALEIKPDHKMRTDLGVAYLFTGEFNRGWEEYENRLNIIRISPLLKPKWAGNSLRDRAILVYHEQGYGDTLQFARYLPKLYDDYGAKKVLFIPQKGLEQLLRENDLRAEILDAKTSVENLNYDANIHLLSLPRIFRTNLENIPFRQKRYLKANQEKVKSYKDRFFSNDKFKIGICWQGSALFVRTKDKSLPLSHFYPLANLPDVKIYSLQKGDGIEQLYDLPEGIDIVNLGETFNDFSDTAAAIENLDIVITVDTSIVHLSGGLGKKTWLLHPPYAEWRWHLDMNYSPWYEDVRLFRHKEFGKKDWEEMMERVVEEIRAKGIGRRV